MLDVGKSTVDVGEQTVGETTVILSERIGMEICN